MNLPVVVGGATTQRRHCRVTAANVDRNILFGFNKLPLERDQWMVYVPFTMHSECRRCRFIHEVRASTGNDASSNSF